MPQYLISDARRAVVRAEKAGRRPAAYHLNLLRREAEQEKARQMLRLKSRCR